MRIGGPNCLLIDIRQSLIVHQAQADNIQRQIKTLTMQQFHLRGLFTQITGGGASIMQASTRRGVNLNVATPFAKTALQIIFERQPATLTWTEWLMEINLRLGPHDGHEAALAEILTLMVIGGHFDMLDQPVPSAMGAGDNPRADPFLRQQSAAGLVSLASIHHETVRLNVVEAALLPRLDSANSLEDLASHLTQAAREGRIVFLREGRAIANAPEIEAAAREHLAASLLSLQAKAALV